MAGRAQIAELVERIDHDDEFASALSADPSATLHRAGFGDLAVAVEEERTRIAELVDRIYREDEFRQSVEKDPRGTLDDLGIPEAAIESVLIVAGAPEVVVDGAAADVEAHLSPRAATFGAVATALGTLAFAQQASARTSPAATTEVSPAAVSAEVSRAVAAPEIRRAVTAPQVSRAIVDRQVRRAARASWQGVSLERLQSQRSVASFLHLQNLMR